ncbi:MAG: 3-deoxy-manno-octulosonate cytidylyltransferase [Saprospiraceae bacterium]
MKVLAIIPARLNSTRLPKKVLRQINGKSLIRRVYEQVQLCENLHEIIVAVDSMEVADHLNSFGARWLMTSDNHISGTDRCSEVLRQKQEFTHVINIQGDEPFIDPLAINQLIDLLKNEENKIVSLMSPIVDNHDFINPNVVKVVVNNKFNALYFSRATIPFQRSISEIQEINTSSYRHIGIYGFEANTLLQITQLPSGNLEKIEQLEQLRWLENSYSIKMGISHFKSLGIDTEDDLNKAIELA